MSSASNSETFALLTEIRPRGSYQYNDIPMTMTGISPKTRLDPTMRESGTLVIFVNQVDDVAWLTFDLPVSLVSHAARIGGLGGYDKTSIILLVTPIQESTSVHADGQHVPSACILSTAS